MKPCLVFLLAMALAGCGSTSSLPSDEELESAKQKVELAVSLADKGKTVLELLGLLPTYECGEDRRTWVGSIVDGFAIEHPCASALAEQAGADGDRVSLTFPAGGCDALGKNLIGEAVFSYSGGSDRFSLDADFTALQVAGETISASAGYGTCGDEKKVWASGAGDVPGTDLVFSLDLTVAIQAGIPIFGSTDLILNGTAELSDGDGTDQVTFVDLEVEAGSLLPKKGLLRILTASGRRIEARFEEGFLTGQVEITVDDYDPVKLPLL